MSSQYLQVKQSVVLFTAVAVMFCFLLPVRGGIFTVTTTNDSGDGSLRQAILNANANPGADTIVFGITAGTPPLVISPASPLPVVSDPVTIDGTTQTGYASAPVVAINGGGAGTNAVGLQLEAGASGSTVLGLALTGFTSHGLVVNGSYNVIQGNFIGVDTTGTNARGNSSHGILINGAGNLIGGTAAGARNVFSGNGQSGLCLNGNTATGNLVQGNYLGTDASGSLAVSNRLDGVTIINAPGNTLGPGNVISGNTNGVSLIGTNATGNVITGNFIGTDATGKTALGNRLYGIYLTNSPANTLGGTAANAGNLISGNWLHGIVFNGGSSSNLVVGNLIGLAIGGTNALPNRQNGIFISGGQANTIGGVTPAARNVISGNSSNGVVMVLASDRLNIISGNFIGTDLTGRKPVANTVAGVWIRGCTNLVGGTKIGSGNVISGNGQQGVWFAGTGTNVSAAGNQVFGNLIGLDGTGTNILGNGNAGIGLSSAAGNQIGGPSASQRNVLSGNGGPGLFMVGTGTTNNVIQGNFLGTDATGTSARANATQGIYAESVGGNNLGGLSAGLGNLISGNGSAGIWLTNTSGFSIQGNVIGLNAAGNSALGNGSPANGWPGILIQTSSNNGIGGTVDGARNVVSGNYAQGISLLGCTAQTVQGNFVGLDAGGSFAIANLSDGIVLYNSSGNLLGGATTSAGNVVAGNGNGVAGGDGFYFSNASQNTIQGNLIGVAADGISPLGNTEHNVEFDVGSTNNILGGILSGTANTIANAKPGGWAGVRVRDGAFNNLISGNSIYNNSSLGIDLGTYLVNANITCESGVAGNAANRGQNYLVLSNAVSGTATMVGGSFNSAPNKTYALQFFASRSGNLYGYGEGQLFLGQTNLTLGAACSTNFSVTLPATVPAGWVVTATATDAAGNTSEFSNWIPATAVPSLQFVLVPGTASPLAIAWTNSGGSFSLQQCTNLNPPVLWTAGPAPLLSNGIYSVLVNPGSPAVYYRLMAQ